MSNLKRRLQGSFALSVVMVLISAFLQTLAIQAFAEPLHLISGGFTGIALFAANVASLFDVKLNVSLIYLLLNIPVAIFCYRALSRRFVILSLIQLLTFSFLLAVWNPEPFFYDRMLNLLFGGLLMGTSTSLALIAGGSGGGTDFIAQYVGSKLHRNIFQSVFIFNCLLILLYGVSYGWLYAGYSIVYQYLATTMINTLYKHYGYTAVEITCSDPKPIVNCFFECVKHGMSIIPVEGGFSGKPYYICKAVISSDEVSRVIEHMHALDEHLIIYTYKVKNFYGSFRLRSLDEL